MRPAKRVPDNNAPEREVSVFEEREREKMPFVVMCDLQEKLHMTVGFFKGDLSEDKVGGVCTWPVIECTFSSR